MTQQKALNDLCARIFREPDRLLAVYAERVRAPLFQPLHQHRDLLQLDLAVGCGGRWLGAREGLKVSGVTAAVFYPRFAHGYEMIPARGSAVLFSLKLRAEPSWPALKQRILPTIVTHCSGETALVRALWKLKRLSQRNSRQSLIAAALSEVLCLWPGDNSGGGATDSLSATDDPVVATVTAMIDARPGMPPTVEELARAAHLSPRQLSRRMRGYAGCSVQGCIAARRLGRARNLLAEGALSITEIAETLGFASIHAFSRWFRVRTGSAPSAWRAQPGL